VSSRKSKKRGFTLVELIVGMTIIMVITVASLVSFQGANKRARDGRRMADLEKIRTALELARQAGTTYPATLTVLTSGSFVEAVPTDPKPQTYGYFYERPTDYTFRVYGFMEDGNNSNGTYSVGAGGTGCGVVCNYRLMNP